MAKQKPADDIVDMIAASIDPRSGFRPWWERVDADQAAMLEVIWLAWKAGTFGTKRLTAAKAISKAIAGRGISIGPQGVLRWLDRTI
jgi:hypothetical protein